MNNRANGGLSFCIVRSLAADKRVLAFCETGLQLILPPWFRKIIENKNICLMFLITFQCIGWGSSIMK